MLTMHITLGIALLVAALALVAYAWLARRAEAAPLGMRLLFMAIAVLLLVQFGAGTGLLARGHFITGAHYGTAILALPILALPSLSRSYNPVMWLASALGLFVVLLGTAVIGWNR
jgi:hypothetical protein